MNVMWIDDDSPATSRQIGEVTVRTAQSLQQAEKMMASDDAPPPDWVVLDLIVPQAGWRKDYLLVPGLAYLHDLTKRPERPRVAVYSIALTPDRAERATSAGAELVLDKQHFSFSQVLERIRSMATKDEDALP